MEDRVPVNPGRVLITPENGDPAFYATMARADNPLQEGTPLNKNTLLKDATAALFGLGSDAVPDDALAAIKSAFDSQAIDIASKAKTELVSYVGTGTVGTSSKPRSLTFSFAPKVVWVLATKISTMATYNQIYPSETYQHISIMIMDLLTTSFVAYAGLGYNGGDDLYGKKSADGKTYYWYTTSGSSSYEFNEKNKTYYVIAFG